MSKPLLTATLIAKNEKPNVRRCLDSLWPHVDEVVIVDTGSDDGTLGAAVRYAKDKRQPDKLKTATCLDCNDETGQIVNFAVARQAADDLATGEFLVWCDLDDEIRGLKTLREYAQNAADEVTGFFCRYRYASDEDDNAISELWRERVVRNDGTPWNGRLHEHKLFTHGQVVKVDPTVAEWVHHRDHTNRTGERNLRILERWLEEEPENPRVVQSLAMELMGEERHAHASDMFARYLALPGEPPDRRAQASRHLCVMLMMQHRVQEAKTVALSSLTETWLWADTHLSLAEVAQTTGRPDEGLVHAQTAMSLGKPDTLLIVNPLQYTAHPRALIGVCLAMMGKIEEASEMLDECLRVAPHYPLAVQHLPAVRAALRKYLAVGSFLPMAETLVEAGDVLKARDLLGCVPWYIADDPRIIGRRAELTRLAADRLAAPAELPADEAADAFIARHLEAA